MKQTQALEIMNSGANVFLTGAPGSGKTFVLNQFIEAARKGEKRIAITASTGMAASHIGGVTIHSWSGLGIAEMITKDDLRRLQGNNRIGRRIRKANILVIDEVSMLHGHRLDMVNVLTKHIRGSKLPFGGLQVILVGDLFQLPPVNRDSSEFDFVHLSYSWEELGLKICYLTEQHRQGENDDLLDLLEAMRSNQLDKRHRNLLQERVFAKADVDKITRLYSHNVDVDSINQQHLDKLPGEVQTFTMHGDGNPYLQDTLRRNVLAPEKLELKLDAEVMFVANNFQEGFFNGTRGTVVKFAKSGDPIVKLKNGRKLTVERHTWAIKEDERVLASIEQIPLRLAWAITIHKSQGMSLDAAQIDLSKAFQPAMGYVALSRVRSLEGLYLVGINAMALTMHEEIYAFDALLQADSELLV